MKKTKIINGDGDVFVARRLEYGSSKGTFEIHTKVNGQIFVSINGKEAIRFKPNVIPISDKRKENLISSFNWIDWNMDSIKITDLGYGDRPQFSILGMYHDEYCVEYISWGCSGGNPRLRINKIGEKKIHRFSGVATHSEKIHEEVRKKLNKG